MSEADSYQHKRKVESSQSGMLCAREQHLDRSFLPLKRKMMFDQHSRNQHFPEDPPSKRFMSEELVASHLEHLKLTSDCTLTPGHDLSLLTVGETKCASPRQLNIKTVASCPHFTGCHVSRKRDYSQCEGHEEFSSWRSKRMRLDPNTRILPQSAKNGSRTNHGMELDPHQHNSTVVLTSVHGIGSVSDLSSIPEETEPSQQPSSPLDSESDPLLNLCVPLSSTFLNPFPPPPPPPTLPVRSLGYEPCSVWLAPEIKTLQTSSLLPPTVVDKIMSTGMELVPWVGLEAVIQRQTPKEKRKEEEELTTQTSSAQNKASRTISNADPDQSIDWEMELDHIWS